MKGCPSFAMEEHWEAYFVWKRSGFKGGWCWHVDAHLDISRDGLDPANLKRVAACRSGREAREQGLMGNSYLPWGGLHCGNYLYPAIEEGMVSRLTWVIPPGLPEGDLLDWSREHLNSWLELSRAEYAELRLEGGRVVGTLLGIPFEMGPLEALDPPTPEPGQPLLVDLDIDYFLNEDGTVWGRPESLLEALRPMRIDCLTVAYSVSGGYTPFEHRDLAAPFLFGAAEDRGEMYRETAQDRMVALVRRHQYDRALEQLESEVSEVAFDPVVRAYYRGSCLHHLGRFEEAHREWSELLQRTPSGLADDGRAYLEGLCSELALKLGRPEQAAAHARAARRLAPGDYRSLFFEAAATEGLGDLRRATQLLRRSLRLAPDYLFTLNMRLGLVRLYRRQKKEGLAQIELQNLRAQDVTGRFLPQVLLG